MTTAVTSMPRTKERRRAAGTRRSSIPLPATDRNALSEALLADATFTYRAPTGTTQVFLAGDFNAWSPRATRMVRRGETYSKRLSLRPGEYQYKFVVDGQWCEDPLASQQAPNHLGSMNSVIRI